MTTVVQFEHRGIECAIPAAQARAVDVRPPDGALTDLWEGSGATHARAMEVRVRDGGVWIGCGSPRLCDLPKTDAVGLSPLLRRILAALPHVVGLADLGGKHTWLVDLDRFEPTRAQEVTR